MSLGGDRLPGSDLFTRRINRAPSLLLATAVPWIVIALASLMPLSPVIASAPVLPPLAYLFLIGWRLLRPGLLPLWAGAPLGLIDDLYSGQPFGSAILLWSLTMIGIELIDGWLRWRGFWQDWLVAMVLITAYLFLGHVFAAIAGGRFDPGLIVPQLLISFIAFPLLTRVIAILDILRLARIRVLG
ncbi:rod shape-determining protein MreD [Croceicoccus naphthovorans]|uniref:Rod shape-determining protein MreD n=1 Tax=Croceicoccus naphthovorans TaxID=1348774 RepID=A0A0G3XF00_9SPHN|nr:rod shape-determining protein MreD [Croceicoccus naphthovorans]AKM10085.1 rod shape-determining protein MreD [Croceicoccus naphthovorans]MBB3991195.1 rod shape-determining protein MreD [Croceicoccus naphthovorans]